MSAISQTDCESIGIISEDVITTHPFATILTVCPTKYTIPSYTDGLHIVLDDISRYKVAAL
jgi:hypothetical protein